MLDRRLGTASYRWDIVNALPPMRRTRDRADVEALPRRDHYRRIADVGSPADDPFRFERVSASERAANNGLAWAGNAVNVEPLVRLEVADAVATITLDSPANRNAVRSRLVADLHAALDGAEAPIAAGDARTIVLTHAPPGSAGCRSQGPAGQRPSGLRSRRAPVRASPRRDRADDRRGVGSGAAGGIGLMASCDLVVVHSDVTFAFTEVRIGVVAAIISVPIFRRSSPPTSPPPHLTGEPFDAEHARRVGLVTHVADDVAAVVAKLCAELSRGPGSRGGDEADVARAGAGRAARCGVRGRCHELSDRHFQSAEAATGMAAFAASGTGVAATATTTLSDATLGRRAATPVALATVLLTATGSPSVPTDQRSTALTPFEQSLDKMPASALETEVR